MVTFGVFCRLTAKIMHAIAQGNGLSGPQK